MKRASGPDWAKLEVRCQARARCDEIAGERQGRLLVRVTAPPLDDRANQALCRLIAKRAGVARGRVSVVRGRRSRDKLVRVEGLSAAQLRDALGLGAQSSNSA
jgi:uncharacterized protein YggU (UPF0235/DUF167 family)